MRNYQNSPSKWAIGKILSKDHNLPQNHPLKSNHLKNYKLPVILENFLCLSRIYLNRTFKTFRKTYVRSDHFRLWVQKQTYRCYLKMMMCCHSKTMALKSYLFKISNNTSKKSQCLRMRRKKASTQRTKHTIKTYWTKLQTFLMSHYLKLKCLCDKSTDWLTN